MKRIETLLDNIQQAVITSNIKQIETLSTDFALMLLEYDDIPESLFMTLLDILRHPNFGRVQGSYVLLSNVFDDVDILSDEQKKELLGVLISIYDSLEDSTTCMIVLEMIVNLFHNEKSFKTLQYLKKTKTDLARAMIAYGLYYFITDSNDTNLIKLAIDELKAMKKDSSKTVQKEVDEALQKLSKR